MTNDAGVCTLEQFGAVGNGATDDTVAFDAACNAIRAGTYNSLVLGARTYLVNPTTVWPFGGSIYGYGASSVLKTTQNKAVLGVYDSVAGNRAKSTSFSDFMILGSIGTNPGYTTQDGIDIGYFGGDGSSRVTISNVVAKQLAGIGFVPAYGDDIAFGALLLGCTADGCWKGLNGYSPGEAVGFRAVNCTNTGVQIGVGNFCLTGGFIRGNTLGMYLGSGGNDGHANITGVSFLHNTTQLQIQTGLVNGEFFSGCRFYEGDLQIPNGIAKAVTFSGCTFDLTSMTLQGKARFLNCSFDSGYTNTLTSTTGGENEFVAPRGLDGSIPAWVGNLIYLPYAFPGDADQTLSSQNAWAHTLILSGTLTAARTLTLGLRPPSKGQSIKVKNTTAQTVNVKWTTGTAVACAAGATITVGADGTNAVLT